MNLEVKAEYIDKLKLINSRKYSYITQTIGLITSLLVRHSYHVELP